MDWNGKEMEVRASVWKLPVLGKETRSMVIRVGMERRVDGGDCKRDALILETH